MKPAVPRVHVTHCQPRSVDTELHDAVGDDDVISFAGGVPADELFPMAGI